MVEFANIIPTLYTNESSQLLLPDSLPHLSIPVVSITITSSFNNLVLCFYRRDTNNEGRQQDFSKFIEMLFFTIDSQTYTKKTRKETATRVIF